MKFRTGYESDKDRDQHSHANGIECPEDEDMVSQEFAEEADINTIVRRFGLTGEIPNDWRQPQTGDFTNITDYQTAMNQVIATRQAFDALPARIRARFHNDPHHLMTFLDDESNRDEAQRLGLLKEVAQSTPGATPATATTEGTKQ